MENIFDLEKEQAEMQVSITFGELQCLACEDVVSCVSQEKALEICKRSVTDLSAKTVEVLSLWLRKLLRAYFNDAICCIEVFKCLYEWFIKLKEDVSPENKTACDDFITLLNDAVGFAEWAKEKLVKAGERLMHTTAFFLLSIVNGCLQQSIENNVDALKEHEPLAIELHMTVLFLLKEITANSSKVHARITPLLRQLIEIADFLGAKMSHLRAFVKTSKTMTNICTHYSSSVDLNQSLPDWLQETILHLCDTVLNNLEIVYQKGVSSVPLDKMEEHLKIAQAYLIMLHKLLSCGVKHMDKTVLDTMILLLMGGESRPTHDLSKEIPILVSKYVRPYVLELFELIYQLNDFQNYLMALLTEPEQADEDYYELCLDYITVVIIDNTEIMPLTCQTVQKIFEYLVKDASNFTNAARYNRLLEVFGSLLYLADSVTLLKYFNNGLFQEDLIKSQVCADVLMICFRLRDENDGWSHPDVVQATDYYIKCNNLYTLFSQNPSQWHIQRMLRYFHKLGNHELPLFNMKNYRYLHCVSARIEQDQRLWTMRLQRILIAPLNDAEQYYEMLALMELLMNSQSDWLHLLAESVKELFKTDKCKLLANIYFKLGLQCNRATQLRILQGAMPTHEIIKSCWHIQKFLHSCKNSDDAQLKSLANLHTITTDLLPLLNALQPPLNYRSNASKNYNFNYQQWDYKRLQFHRCKLSSQKRKRSENEPKELIQQLESNSKELLLYSGELDASDVMQLRSTISNLKQLLSS
ncbi:uncharacterized protein LOC117783581 [Drosophila innubila]|uniref:uncharacterized protein LOC117783581 n=1 Tax=Drosophila innubila TaxID=198719 RepID=UPI00148BFC47|nr:uncharacterized protein LOC117783581 [Drosophila innubila]